MDPGLPRSMRGLLSMEGGLERAKEAMRMGHAAAVRLANLSLDPVVTDPHAIWCLARNFKAHADEIGVDVPLKPMIFHRVAASQIGNLQPLVRPQVSEKFDYEGELAIVIGREGRHIARADALGHVAGFSCYNEGSVRDWQRHSSQIGAGKNFAGTGAFGPWLVTPDEVGDIGSQILSTRLNGVQVQHAALYRHFESRGLQPVEVECEECKALNQGRTFRVKEPASGLTFEFYAEVIQMIRPFTSSLAKIARLGHVVIGASSFDSTYNSLINDFGFRVSDYTPGRFAFLRCFPNPYHHSFAVGQAERNHLHHINFMVSEIDDIGRAVNRLRDAGVEISFGPGRHHASGSVFLYFSDPDGLTAEYSYGMEEFSEIGAREARMLERGKDAADLWGGSPSPAFGAAGGIG
ncbi:fumarylacetoacetate hydrolase family protein [Cupriavidus basilensis]|nr:fumarylacetoacetate hydrolase family protein [Cupriavidus basilensis]